MVKAFLFSNFYDASYIQVLANLTYLKPNAIELFQQVFRTHYYGLLIDNGSRGGLFGAVAIQEVGQKVCDANPK